MDDQSSDHGVLAGEVTTLSSDRHILSHHYLSTDV